MAVITIVGAGMMGSAMSRPATDNGHSVRLVGSPLDAYIIDALKAGKEHPTLHRMMPENTSFYHVEELEKALEGADIVLGGISSFGITWFGEKVLPLIKSGTPVLTITKGLDLYGDGLLRPFPEYLETLRSDLEYCAVGGPCICFELFDRRHTLVYYCGKNKENVKKMVETFRTSYYHLTPTLDVAAVECSVAMKNAYAMGVSLAIGMAEKEKGITDGRMVGNNLAPGAPDYNPVYNPQAALFAQSCLEMRRLVKMMGGYEGLVAGLPGAGDLYVTIVGGRTRRLGTLLGRGLPYKEVKEILAGVTLEAVAIITRMASAVRSRAARGEVRKEDFPLLLHMDAILNEGAEVAPDWDAFGEKEVF